MTKKRIACVTLPVIGLAIVGICAWLPGVLLLMALRGVAAAIGWLVGPGIAPPSHQLPAHMPDPEASWG